MCCIGQIRHARYRHVRPGVAVVMQRGIAACRNCDDFDKFTDLHYWSAYCQILRPCGARMAPLCLKSLLFFMQYWQQRNDISTVYPIGTRRAVRRLRLCGGKAIS